MSLISFSQISDGSTASASQVNTPLSTIYNDYNGNITDANIASGANIAASKLAFGGTWSSWTPSWTNLTIGNATVSGTYIQIGKTVIFYLHVVLGSTSSVSTSPFFSLPVNSSTNYITTSNNFNIIGNGQYFAAATGPYIGYVAIDATGGANNGRLLCVSSGTPTTYAALTATVPNTWTTGNIINISGTYQAA